MDTANEEIGTSDLLDALADLKERYREVEADGGSTIRLEEEIDGIEAALESRANAESTTDRAR